MGKKQMSPARLSAIQARVDMATPGPWNVDEYGGMIWADNPYGHDLMRVADIRGWSHLTGSGACAMSNEEAQKIQDANQIFIAASRRDVVDLLNEVRRLTAERDALKHDLYHLANTGTRCEICAYRGGKCESDPPIGDCWDWRDICDENADSGAEGDRE